MNYNSIEEILSAGITNMQIIRDNSKNDDGTDSIIGVSWFTFNDVIASTIYASGNSWIGFGLSSEHLKVNRRDGAVYSIYREEGTLYDYYKFLKIRWKGYSYYGSTSSSYAIEYDVILWDTGDISLHMISMPTSYNDGTYSLAASSTYSYTVSTSAPDVTFTKTDFGFSVSNNVIDLKLPTKIRYLIRSGSKYYTVVNEILNEINISSISSEAFLSYGIETVPSISLMIGLSNPELLYWTDKGTDLTTGLVVEAIPPLPQIILYPEQDISSTSGIKIIEATASSDALFTITFDYGTTWYYFNNNSWAVSENYTDGMTKKVLKQIMPENWSEITTSSTYQVRCALPSVNSYTSTIAVGHVD